MRVGGRLAQPPSTPSRTSWCTAVEHGSGGAIREAGSNRFRSIFLTSLTTFVGLAPLMLERALPAAFLVPMAVSLAFGVLFATFITLILVPTA